MRVSNRLTLTLTAAEVAAIITGDMRVPYTIVESLREGAAPTVNGTVEITWTSQKSLDSEISSEPNRR